MTKASKGPCATITPSDTPAGTVTTPPPRAKKKHCHPIRLSTPLASRIHPYLSGSLCFWSATKDLEQGDQSAATQGHHNRPQNRLFHDWREGSGAHGFDLVDHPADLRELRF